VLVVHRRDDARGVNSVEVMRDHPDRDFGGEAAPPEPSLQQKTQLRAVPRRVDEGVARVRTGGRFDDRPRRRVRHQPVEERMRPVGCQRPIHVSPHDRVRVQCDERIPVVLDVGPKQKPLGTERRSGHLTTRRNWLAEPKLAAKQRAKAGGR